MRPMRKDIYKNIGVLFVFEQLYAFMELCLLDSKTIEFRCGNNSYMKDR